MYVANDGLRPQTNQSANATKKTLNLERSTSAHAWTMPQVEDEETYTFAIDPKTGSVQTTSNASKVIETASTVSSIQRDEGNGDATNPPPTKPQ
jgi:hypothetical protein